MFLPTKYFQSEWSFAQYKTSEVRSICVFGDNNTIIGKHLIYLVINDKGKVTYTQFDGKKGGDCSKLTEYDITN